ELLVVRPRDLGNAPQLPGPRDLAEELKRVDHVRLDLAKLLGREAAPRDGEDRGLRRGDEGLLLAEVIDVRPTGEAANAVAPAVGQYGGLVGVGHQLELVVDVAEQARQLGVPGRRLVHAAGPQGLEFAARVLELEPALDDLAAVADQIEVPGVEL